MSFDVIAKFVLGQDTEIPKEALEMAALLLLDTTGVAAGAKNMEAGRIAREIAANSFNATPGNGVPMLFDGRIVSATGAAFAAATQIDNLDAHDGYNPTKGHIGCAVVPALYALASQNRDLSGMDALKSLAISYEVAARAGIALHASVDDYHTSGAWNSLGVAAMGCRIVGTNAEILRHAFGIAEYHGPRSQMMREIETPTMLHDGSGMGAMVGLMAVEMATKGFHGAPATTVESEDASQIWSDLGKKWTILDNYVKPYPICRWAHAAIDAVLAIRKLHTFRSDEINNVTVRTFSEASCLFSGIPDTTSKAQYSMAFSIATFLKHERIGVEHISPQAFADPDIADLVERIKVVDDPRHSDRFPNARWSDVTIELSNGTRLESGDVHARGGPESPMETDEIRTKFMEFCQSTLKNEIGNRIWETGLKLKSDGEAFSELGTLVTDPANFEAV